MLMVASEEEKKVAEDNLVIIKRFFLNYGFDFVKLNVSISDSVRNYKALNEEKQQIQQMLDETKSIETYKLKQQQNKENEVKGTFSYTMRSQPTFKSVSDLPINSMEVEEFKQTEGTDRVEVLATIVASEIRSFRSRQGRDFTLLVATISNFKDSIMIKRFIKETEILEYRKKLVENTKVKVKDDCSGMILPKML